MSKLIGLAANGPGAGKSTVAHHLVEAHDFERIRFAGPLKRMIGSLLTDLGYWDWRDYTDGHLKEVVIPEVGYSARHLMQTLGTDWGRTAVRPGFWLDVALRQIDESRADGGSVVIDDVRFRNEADAIRERGGTLVYISRPGVEVESAYENQLVDYRFDVIIPNTGSVETLYNAADLLTSI